MEWLIVAAVFVAIWVRVLVRHNRGAESRRRTPNVWAEQAGIGDEGRSSPGAQFSSEGVDRMRR